MSHRFASFRVPLVVLFLLSGGLADALADEKKAAWASDTTNSPAVLYLDGDKPVLAERLGPAEADAKGRSLLPVRLHYGARVFEASVDDTALVSLGPGGEQVLADAGIRIVEPLMPSIGLFRVASLSGEDGLFVTSLLATENARMAGVRSVVPNLYLRVEPRAMPFVPDDPRFPSQWYFDEKRLQMAEAWGITQGDAKTTIVVVDTGCDMTHPDLADKYDPGIDVLDGDDDPSYDPAYFSADHGTACAGLVAAKTNNAVGIAGACPNCRIRCVRLISDVLIPLSAHVKAFEFALDTGAAVVSNSWGFANPTPVPQMLRDAIDNVFDHGRGGKGAVVMFAAGNENREIMADELYAVRGVTAVGAINQYYDKTNFTNFGDAVDLVAPIGTLTTDIAGPGGADPTDYTTDFGGTSSACPVAAGVAALLMSAMPEKTSVELVDLMVKTAKLAPYATPDANGHDAVFGFGILDPVNALKTGLGLVDEPPPPAPAAPAIEEEEGCQCRAGISTESRPLRGQWFYGAVLLSLAAFLRRRTRR